MMVEISRCDLLVCLVNVRMTLLFLSVTFMISKGLLLICLLLHCYQNELTLMTTIFKFTRKHTICVALVGVCDTINTILGELRFLITITS